jgi:hypothetical protein
MNHDQVLAAAKKVFEKNPQLERTEVKMGFKRTVTTFYPALCLELYGNYNKEGPYYARAMQLFREIQKDNLLIDKIMEINLNEQTYVDNDKVIFLSKKITDKEKFVSFFYTCFN